MEINEKLLRQIDVLRDMKGGLSAVSLNAPAASATPQTAAPAGGPGSDRSGRSARGTQQDSHYLNQPGILAGANRQYRRLTA